MRAGTETKYWWGSDFSDSRLVANIADESVKRMFPKERYEEGFIPSGYNDGYTRTAPVGSFEANPFGLNDLTGNVEEWTADFYDNYERSSPKNPRGPTNGGYRVFRGGSWHDTPYRVRSASRSGTVPTIPDDTIGFRCARDSSK